MSRPFRKRVKYFFIHAGLQAVIAICKVTPRKVLLEICGRLNLITYAIIPKERKRTIDHLSLAFPLKSQVEIEALAKKCYYNLGRNFGEFLRGIRHQKAAYFERIIRVKGWHHLENAIAQKKGVVMITGHIGAFELCASYISLKGIPLSVASTSLKDPKLNSILVNSRESKGIKNIPRGSSSFSLLKALKKEETIGLLIDQDTKVKSVFVPFFGHECATPVGPALLAMKMGSPVIAMGMHLAEDGQQELNILPEIELKQTGNEEEDLISHTAILTKKIEELIMIEPSQWVWMHQRWKTKRKVAEAHTLVK